MTFKELQPCPFCGNKEIEVEYDDYYNGFPSETNFHCKNCGATVKFRKRTREKEKNAWNRRANDDKQ